MPESKSRAEEAGERHATTEHDQHDLNLHRRWLRTAQPPIMRRAVSVP